MMFYVEGSILFGVVMGSLSFILNYGHLLNSLLSLEFLSLMIYWLLAATMAGTGKDFFFSLFYLVMVACESVLGLSLLISGIYSHGLDHMKGYSALSC